MRVAGLVFGLLGGIGYLVVAFLIFTLIEVEQAAMYAGEFANLRQNPLEEGRFILIVGASLAAIIGAVVSLRSAAAGFVLMGGSAGFLFFFPGINLATALPFVLLLLGVVFVAIDLGMSDDSKVQSPSD